MVRDRLRAAALLLTLGFAGCAQPKPAAVEAQAPPASPPPPGIEGRYRGTARLIYSNNRFCPRSGPRVYEVQNGAVTLSYQGAGRRRVPLTAPIQSNGDFDASDGEGRLQGHLGDGTLVATIASQYCEHRWTMRQVD